MILTTYHSFVSVKFVPSLGSEIVKEIREADSTTCC